MTTTLLSGANSGPTSPQEDHPAGTYATYVPHDLAYNIDFEDSLIAPVLHASNKDGSAQPISGVRVIPTDSNEEPVPEVSVRASDISPESLPAIAETDLPLPLDDSRRKYASPLPGVLLTHPSGYLEGGPPLDPTLDTFAEDFLSHRPHIDNPTKLKRAVQKEIDSNVEILKERLRARQKAKEKNEQVAKELKVLNDQHDMELRIHERMQADAAKKKEAKEMRRREREGGSSTVAGGGDG